MSDAPQKLDSDALERLRMGLRLIALRSMSDADAAEEVVQESLARGLAAIERDCLEDPKKVGAYFRAICRNLIVDTVRDRSRTTSLDLLPEPADLNPSNNALQTLISEEQKARVISALRALSRPSRECLRLSFYEGLKPAEVAKRLGEPGPRIRKRQSRALQQLRELLMDQTGSVGCHGVYDPTSYIQNKQGIEQNDRADELR